MKNILLISFWFINFQLYAQNLLLNPGFEDYRLCPTGITSMNYNSEIIPFWSCPTKGTPDYFNKCSKDDVGVPRNFAGDSNPVSGKGYLGLLLCGSKFNQGYREYAQGKLIQPLIKGQDYLVKLNYRLASLSKYSVNQLGIYMSVDSLYINTREELKFNPQIKFDLKVSDDWILQKEIYTAKGGEKYLIIGNFNDSLHTIRTTVNDYISNRRGKEYAYYYLDDISIEPVLNLSLTSFISDTINDRLIDINGEIYKFNRNKGSDVSIKNDSKTYEFSLTDMQVDYRLADNYIVRFQCKDLANCIKCNTSANQDILPVLDIVFKNQADAVKFYNKIKK
jgi:hypothetical protein